MSSWSVAEESSSLAMPLSLVSAFVSFIALCLAEAGPPRMGCEEEDDNDDADDDDDDEEVEDEPPPPRSCQSQRVKESEQTQAVSRYATMEA